MQQRKINNGSLDISLVDFQYGYATEVIGIAAFLFSLVCYHCHCRRHCCCGFFVAVVTVVVVVCHRRSVVIAADVVSLVHQLL